MELISENKSFGGSQRVYSHASETTATDMRFAVYLPEASASKRLPVLWYLSGLTCTEENFTVKSGFQRYAAEHEIIVVAPDTSPRGAGIAGEDDSYDFGTGAGFYIDATQSPWDTNYRMYSYITDELYHLINEQLPVDKARQGISGHSMGGHGALTIALKHPEQYHSVSAFSPICAPSASKWGQKALTGYLGEDSGQWEQYDAVRLLKAGHRCSDMLVDIGDADPFLTDDLMPERLQEACNGSGQTLRLRLQPGYDHSYFFVASFIADHIAFHAEQLKAR